MNYDNDKDGVSNPASEYFYVKNIQGDVVAILDSSGDVIVEYKYDTWGNVLEISGSLKDTIGVKNPYRYRGWY